MIRAAAGGPGGLGAAERDHLVVDDRVGRMRFQQPPIKRVTAVAAAYSC
ncbi:hypothetical protein ABT061_32005 [Streptosporangium sp. NPDC002544]